MATTSLYLDTSHLENDPLNPNSYTYCSPLEDVISLLIDQVPELESSAMPKLAEEIATGCLLFACTWLSTGGVGLWKEANAQACRDNIFVCLTDLNKINRSSINDSHYGFTLVNRWHIPFPIWVKACSVFTYWIADTTLRYNRTLIDELAKADLSRVSVTPRQIIQRSGQYQFTLNVFVRHVLHQG